MHRSESPPKTSVSLQPTVRMYRLFVTFLCAFALHNVHVRLYKLACGKFRYGILYSYMYMTCTCVHQFRMTMLHEDILELLVFTCATASVYMSTLILVSCLNVSVTSANACRQSSHDQSTVWLIQARVSRVTCLSHLFTVLPVLVSLLMANSSAGLQSK